MHNEHNPGIKELETFWDDCSFLQDIAKLYLSTVGEIFLGTQYAPMQETGANKVDLGLLLQLQWVINLLEKVLGKEKVKTWWE